MGGSNTRIAALRPGNLAGWGWRLLTSRGNVPDPADNRERDGGTTNIPRDCRVSMQRETQILKNCKAKRN
jgi:hypothetical protein